MKFNHLALAFLSLLMMSACVKTKTGSVQQQPESKKSEPIKIAEPDLNVRPGYRCNITGLNDNNKGESKDIFFQIDREVSPIRLSFYKSSASGSSILFFIDSFDGHILFGFNMEDENGILSGETVLIHKKIASLTPDENAIYGKLKLSLDENLNGKIERKLGLLNEDSSITVTDFEDFAEISNCETIEALWM
jgi:hypothetical protein